MSFLALAILLHDLPAQDCGNLSTDWRNPECGSGALEPIRIGKPGSVCLLYLGIIRRTAELRVDPPSPRLRRTGSWELRVFKSGSFNFEKLDVLQSVCWLLYELTGDFPDEEGFGLTNQMRRASVSISSNIAEGSSRVSRTDFARFVQTATGLLANDHRAPAKADRAERLQSNLRGSWKAEQDA